jgi:hypothetical protein
MGYLHHYAGAVASLVARLGTSVLHVFEHTQGIVNQFVTLTTMNVYHHAHTAGIVFVFCLIKSIVLFTLCHIILL